MIRIPLDITYANDTKEQVTAIGKDTIAFERQYDKPISALGTRLEYMWFVAWHALKRTNKTELPFDDWLDTVGEIKDEEATDIVPLERSQPTGS